MTQEEYRTAVLETAYLCDCAVNGQVPDTVRVKQMNLSDLYQAADRHLLTGITAMALESAGVYAGKREGYQQACVNGCRDGYFVPKV